MQALILAGELEQVAELVSQQKSALRYLLRLLCSLDDLVKWRTAETLGLLGASWAEQGQAEQTRILLRKLLWTLNDESGGIGWGAPESIGEIVRQRPQVFAEFAPILLTYTEEEILLPAVIWGGWRIALQAPELVQEFIPAYLPYLEHSSPQIRGYSWLWLRAAGVDLSYLDWSQEEARIKIYQKRQIQEVALKNLGREFL